MINNAPVCWSDTTANNAVANPENDLLKARIRNLMVTFCYQVVFALQEVGGGDM